MRPINHPEEDYHYTSGGLDLAQEVAAPRYESAVEWMRVAESKAIAFDIWARGNYSRRLLHNRAQESHPVLVPFEYVDELRWAYRRLALMGLPMEFVYTGGLGQPQRVLTLHPAGDYQIDAGWGYIAALGSTTRKRGREWFPVMGFSKLMPESVLDWLIDEAPDAFVRGDIFVAPAELIGIGKSDFEASSAMLTDVQEGVLISDSLKATEVLGSIDLPYLDHLNTMQFNRLLQEHADDLVRFRQAIRKLVKGEGAVDAALEEIRAEVAEMAYSNTQQRLRTAVTKVGGVFTTTAAFVGAAVGTIARTTNQDAILAAIGAATATAVGATLIDLWKQSAERKAKIREKKFSLFWDLGLQKPVAVQRRKVELKFRKYNRVTPALDDSEYDCHWLCPPTAGLQFLAVREKAVE